MPTYSYSFAAIAPKLPSRTPISRTRAQTAAHGMRSLVVGELIEIAAFAAPAGAHDIARNLRAGPDVRGKTDRTAARRAICAAAVGDADGDRGGNRIERPKGVPARRRLHDQALDAKAVLVRQERDLEGAAMIGETRLAGDDLRGGRRKRHELDRGIGKNRHEQPAKDRRTLKVAANAGEDDVGRPRLHH